MIPLVGISEDMGDPMAGEMIASLVRDHQPAVRCAPALRA
jgi:hypothetical protein